MSAPGRAPVPRSGWFAALALALAGGALFFLSAGGIGKNLVYYWGPTELHRAGSRAIGASVRLGGLVAPGSVVRVAGRSDLEFDVVDRQGGRVHVRTRALPPQMFREKIGVVVEGTLAKDGSFEGHRLLVSHGNEYRLPGEDRALEDARITQAEQPTAGTSAP